MENKLFKTFLATDTKGAVKSTQQVIRATLKQLTDDFNNQDISPADLYTTYFGKNDSRMKDLNQRLASDYSLSYRVGHKNHSFYIHSLRQFDLAHFILSNYKQSEVINLNNMYVRFKVYDPQKYLFICRLTAAMLLNKYEANCICSEHILYQCVCNMFYSFQVYDGDRYLINLDDIVKAYTYLITKETIDDLQALADQYKFRVIEKVPATPIYTGKTKPESKEDILELFDDDIEKYTQQQIIDTICKWYPNISQRTARRQMSKFGLTAQKYTRAEYKELHEHVDDATTDILEEIDDKTTEIINLINDKADRSHLDATGNRDYLISIQQQLVELNNKLTAQLTMQQI